jgi:hypothetical protein
MYDSFNRDNKSLSSYWKDIKHIVKKWFDILVLFNSLSKNQ